MGGTLTLSRPPSKPITAKHDISDKVHASGGRQTNKCFILIGPPCSGRSTWADAIVRNTRGRSRPVIICDDDLIHEEMERTGETFEDVSIRTDPAQSKQILMSRFHQAIGVGRDIIVDRHNLSEEDRGEFLATLPDSYQKIAILFTLPRLLLYKRLEDRHLETGRPFSKPVIDNMMRRYERPGHHEFHRTTEIDHLCVYTTR